MFISIFGAFQAEAALLEGRNPSDSIGWFATPLLATGFYSNFLINEAYEESPMDMLVWLSVRLSIIYLF